MRRNDVVRKNDVTWRYNPAKWSRACLRWSIALTLASILAFPGMVAAAMWRDTGIASQPDLSDASNTLTFTPDGYPSFCLDATRRATLFVNDRASAFRVDWTTGGQLALYPARFRACVRRVAGG